jgi:hypothetical protein
MTEDAPPTPGRGSPTRRWWLAVALLAACYGGIIATYASPDASGSDQSGYLNGARLIAAGRRFGAVRTPPGLTGEFSPWLLTPLGFAPAPVAGLLAPAYPVGFPLHLVAGSWVVGWARTGILVQALAGAAFFVLVVGLGRELGLPLGLSTASAAVLAAFPVSFHFFTWMMSDGLATTWCTAAVLCALLARRRAAFAAAAGFAFGVAVLVRPTDVLLLPALALALPGRWRAWLRFAAGGVPAAVFLVAWNVEVYSRLLGTGYGDLDRFFAVSYFWPRVVHFLVWLGRLLGPPVLLLWLGSVARAVRGERRHLVLLVWFVPMVVFYAFYFYSNEAWWYLRFILPVVPGLVLGAALFGHELVGAAYRRFSGRLARVTIAAAAVTVLIVALACSHHYNQHFRVTRIARGTADYPRSIAWAESRLPDRAPVLCMQVSGAMFYYSERPFLRWDLMAPEEFVRARDAARSAGAELYALLFEIEVEKFLARAPGAWEQVGRSGRASLWRPRAEAPPPPAPASRSLAGDI